jgi:hypothetical protein
VRVEIEKSGSFKLKNNWLSAAETAAASRTTSFVECIVRREANVISQSVSGRDEEEGERR